MKSRIIIYIFSLIAFANVEGMERPLSQSAEPLEQEHAVVGSRAEIRRSVHSKPHYRRGRPIVEGRVAVGSRRERPLSRRCFPPPPCYVARERVCVPCEPIPYPCVREVVFVEEDPCYYAPPCYYYMRPRIGFGFSFFGGCRR